jgi:hypothetical protein
MHTKLIKRLQQRHVARRHVARQPFASQEPVRATSPATERVSPGLIEGSFGREAGCPPVQVLHTATSNHDAAEDTTENTTMEVHEEEGSDPAVLPALAA